jgi:hypothetical protein
MPDDFFGGYMLNPLDFPNWQPIGAMEGEDMFDFSPTESEDPVNMLPSKPWQSAIQDPAQEAFQFPFQFPMQDASGGEGGQYAPVDVPEDLLQEAGMSGLPVDENASQTNESMTQQQGMLGDIENEQLWGDVAKMMNPMGMSPSDEPMPSTVEDMFGTSSMQQANAMMNPQGVAQAEEETIPQSVQGMFGAALLDMQQAQQMMNPTDAAPSDLPIPGTIEQMYGASPMEQARQMMNPAGEAQAEEAPIPQTVEGMYAHDTMADQVQKMMNPQGAEPSDEAIPQTTEGMYDASAGSPIFAEPTYAPEETEEDEGKPDKPPREHQIDFNKSLLSNVWAAAKQQSETEDWGVVGDILQNINPNKSLAQNILDWGAKKESSPVVEQTEQAGEKGIDKASAPVVGGQVAELVGADVLPSVTEILTILGSL